MSSPSIIVQGKSTAEYKQRENWIDCLRGIVMLAVVFGHVELFIPSNEVSTIGFFLGHYHLLVFFFICGFFSFSHSITFHTPANLHRSIAKKIMTILWPTIILLILYYCIFLRYLPPVAVIFDVYKGGYWFTYVLIQMYLLAIPLICLLNIQRVSRYVSIPLAIIFAACIAALFDVIPVEFFTRPSVLILSFEKVIFYMPYFILGISWRLIFDRLRPRLKDRWVLPIAASSALLAFVTDRYVPTSGALHFAIHAWILVSVFTAFFGLRKVFDSHSMAPQLLALVGRETLVIYLFHYFFVRAIYTIIIHFVPSQSLPEQLISPWTSIVLTIAITAACIIANKMLSRMGISSLIFPQAKGHRQSPLLTND